MTPQRLLILAFLIFSVGLYGVLARVRLIAVLLAIELMFNAANLAVLALAWSRGAAAGATLVLFGIAVTVAEVAVGLALALLAERVRRSTVLDDLDVLRG